MGVAAISKTIDTIKIRVLLFAILADAAGTRRLELAVPVGSTVADAGAELARQVPALSEWVGRVAYAVNRNYSPPETQLQDGDELALLPPVSGGAGGDGQILASRDGGRFLVTGAPLSTDVAAQLVGHNLAGAICVFAGAVREITGDHRTLHLEYDAYAEMAVSEMARIADTIQRRWPNTRVAMHHRIGHLDPGEVSVVVAVAAPHRPAAFEACRFGIDELKRQVPIWKKEVYADGSHWVGRDGDGPLPGDQ